MSSQVTHETSASVAALSGVDLDSVAFRFWQLGQSTAITHRRFWQMVQTHIDRVSETPDTGGVSLIMGHTSPDQMALFVALIAAGRLAALFPPNTPLQDEAAYFNQQQQSLSQIAPTSVYVFEPHLTETISRINPALGACTRSIARAVVDLSSESDGAMARGLFSKRLASAAPIFLQHSSGTTGIKKAVAITGHALTSQFTAYWPGLRAACGVDRLTIASWLPMYHDMGLLTSLLLPLIGGDSVSLVDPFEWIGKPGTLFEMIERDECLVTWLPNFAFRHLVRLQPALQRRRLQSVLLWIDCSEPCRFADAVGFERAFGAWGVRPGSVLGCYAMAETVFAATQCWPREQNALAVRHVADLGVDLRAAGAVVVRAGAPDADKLVLSSGRALPGIEVSVLVEDRHVGEGIYGEIAIRGECVFSGYRGLSRVDSNLLEDGFLRTGDLGTIVDGHVYVFGRLKEIIIVNGKNLFAGDLEDALNTIPGVRKGRVVAFGIESAQTGSEELVIVAESDSEAGVSPSHARQEVSRVISELFLVRPRDVRIVEDRWLVKSTSGKMSRDGNKAKYIAAFRTSPAGRP